MSFGVSLFTGYAGEVDASVKRNNQADSSHQFLLPLLPVDELLLDLRLYGPMEPRVRS